MNDKLKAMVIHIIQTDPKIRHLIEMIAAKARFERVNCRYLGLCGDECSCQK